MKWLFENIRLSFCVYDGVTEKWSPFLSENFKLAILAELQ